jgi:hypothetical protein
MNANNHPVLDFGVSEAGSKSKFSNKCSKDGAIIQGKDFDRDDYHDYSCSCVDLNGPGFAYDFYTLCYPSCILN